MGIENKKVYLLLFIISIFLYFGMLFTTIATLFSALVLLKPQKEKNLLSKQNIPLILLILYFLFSALTYLWSEDKISWKFDTQVKLSLFAIPFLYLFGKTNEEIFKIFAKTFFYASVLISIIHLSVLVYNFTIKDYTYYMLISSYFTLFMHPSYYSLYLDFAIISGFYLFKTNKISTGSFLKGLLFILLNIFLAMSKISIIITFVIIILAIFSITKGKWSLYSVLLLSIFAILTYYSSPKFQEMIQNIPKYKEILKQPSKAQSSTEIRILTWNATIQIINKNNFIIGNGSGDAKNLLLEFYKANNYIEPYKKSLNSHNQFLETLNSTGIIGFILIVSSIFFSLYYSIKGANYLLFWFLIIIIANFMVESLLNRQNGVLFFSLFFSILNKFDYEK